MLQISAAVNQDSNSVTFYSSPVGNLIVVALKAAHVPDLKDTAVKH